VHWYSQAEYAALTGDVDAAFRHLQVVLEKGFSSAARPLPTFEPLADDQRFQAFRATGLERANRERAELGMGPYEPPLLFE